MAVTHVFTPALAATTSGGSGATVARSYTSNPQAGDLLWCATWAYTATETCTGVADDNGNTWIQAGGPITASGGTGERGYIFYAKNANAGATTVTATWSSTTPRKALAIGAIRGLGSGGDLDQFVGNGTYTGGSLKLTAGTFTTFAQAEVGVVAFYVSERSGTPDSPLTADLLYDNFNFERFAIHTTSSNAGFTAQWSIGTGASEVIALAAAFKDAGGGGSNVPLNILVPNQGILLSKSGRF